MLNDEPDARGLIAIALENFRQVILPTVPEAQRFTALMIANALAIAERELVGDPQRTVTLADAVGGLLGRAGSLDHLLPLLSQAITAGAFDPPARQQALRAVLLALTRARLAVSNPKALAGGGR